MKNLKEELVCALQQLSASGLESLLLLSVLIVFCSAVCLHLSLQAMLKV